jgi:hypothetical protein
MLASPGEQLDPDNIKQLIRHVENSFVQGNIYYINYSVTEKRTDAFYNSRNALIQLIDKKLAMDANQQASGTASADLARSDKTLRDLKASYAREMGHPRESTCISDYSVDGTGFYLKQVYHFVNSEGKKSSSNPATYVSDGKITGIFYPQSGQAVIQPATERPQVPAEYWTDIAYYFSRKPISEYCDKLQTFNMSGNDQKIIITGDRTNPKGGKLHVELQIDKASLLPEKMDSTYHTPEGVLDNESVKTWQFQDISGMKWPKVVVDQQYRADVNRSLNLETEQTFVVNALSFTPMNSKAELAALLKGDYNVFDQITGTHYVSGNPGHALDNLSK